MSDDTAAGEAAPAGEIPDWVRDVFPAVPDADRPPVAATAPAPDPSGRRWAVLSGAAVAQVLDYDPAGVFPPGAFRPCPPGTLPGDLWDGAGFARPAPPAPPPAPRVVSAAAFYALFTPDETTALCGVPEFTGRAIQVLAQGTANLDSDELTELLGKAVTQGLLTDARAREIAAGEPPPA